MKKILSVFTAIVMAAILNSCGKVNCQSSSMNEAKSNLQSMITGMNEACPISVGQNVICEKISYDNDIVTMSYCMPSFLLNLDDVRANIGAFKKNTLLGMVNSNNEGIELLFNLMDEANASFRMIYRTEKDDAITLDFTLQEVNDAMAKSSNSSLAMLQALADNAELQTPTTISEGLVMTDVLIDDDCFVYVYSCDEDIYDIDAIEENAASSKGEILTYILSDEPILNQLRKLLKECNYRMAYKYIGDTSGKSYTIYITPEEL